MWRHTPICIRDLAENAERRTLSQQARWLGAIRDRARPTLGQLLDLLLPPVCGYCNVSLLTSQPPMLCGLCCAKLTIDRQVPCCLGCGLWRPSASGVTEKCPECQHRRFAFQAVVSIGGYRSDLRLAAIRMKRFEESALTVAAGELLVDALERRSIAQPDAIVPIPKHWTKRVWRGVNSAELLARTIGQSCDIPIVLLDALRCMRATRKQSLLTREERQRNLKNVFQTNSQYDFRGAHILIVDDIMTTGSTAHDAAKALRKAGAKQVTVAVAARAQGGRQPTASAVESERELPPCDE
ncbi:MAG: ComF family protein [Planctomycetales bacterium]|nr:ComF family protein [Planctomycetales bacterium]MCA9169583.1 ComF family protein [Planctomycetales bacterium]